MNRPGTEQERDAPTLAWSSDARLRRAFLDGTAGARDYWTSERDLASYDATTT